MSRRRPNPRLVKIHRSYTVEEVARTLGTHKNTVRAWIRQGLPTIDRQRPALVHGLDLVRFLDSRRKDAKTPARPDTSIAFAAGRRRRLPAAWRITSPSRPRPATSGASVPTAKR